MLAANVYEPLGGSIPGDMQYCTILVCTNGTSARHEFVKPGPSTICDPLAMI